MLQGWNWQGPDQGVETPALQGALCTARGAGVLGSPNSPGGGGLTLNCELVSAISILQTRTIKLGSDKARLRARFF